MEFPLKLETLFGDDYCVGSSMPLSNEARPRFDPRLSRGCDPPIALELGGETRQTPQRRLRQAAEGDLLNANASALIMRSRLKRGGSAVTGLGGHVLKRLGDGLMALFGYPQAQENDAERAVRAVFAIQRALADINARSAAKGAPHLSARASELESGPVVVEATGEVFGDAPNVAARVQGIAEPGSVLITMNVQRQIAGLFVVEEQGARELKGVSEPVQLFRIVRASGGGRRGGARTLTPFVGRGEELGLLTRRWERARGRRAACLGRRRAGARQVAAHRAVPRPAR